MAIIGFIDPKGRKRTLDDIAINLTMPQPILQDMVKRENDDGRHRGTRLTVTGPNGCPRQLAITRMTDYYVEPEKQWPMLGGTYLHEVFGEKFTNVEKDGKRVWYTEEADEDKCVFNGVIRGREVSCKLDLLTRNIYDNISPSPFGDTTKHVWDWKTSFNKGHSFAGKEKVGRSWVYTGRAKASHSAQLNLGRMLMEQAGLEVRDVELTAWIVSGKWVPTTAEHLTEDQVMGLYPGGPVYSYGEMFDAIGELFDKWNDAAVPYEGDIDKVPMAKRLEIIRGMPIYGREMFKNRYGGYMCTDYCGVKRACDDIEGGI